MSSIYIVRILRIITKTMFYILKYVDSSQEYNTNYYNFIVIVIVINNHHV